MFQVASRGLNALAVIDSERIDGRDLIWQAGLLAYAIRRLDGPVTELFEAAAALADGQTRQTIREVGERKPSRLLTWGFREVQTADGIGLSEDDGARYQARADLVALAERIAAQIAADGSWQLSEPVVGSRLQPVWLRAGLYPEPEPELDQARNDITGCVLIRGGVESTGSVLEAQHLLMFLAQTSTASAAEIIARAAGPGTGTWFAGFGVAAGHLCAVLIARSVIAEVPPVEDPAVAGTLPAGPGRHPGRRLSYDRPAGRADEAPSSIVSATRLYAIVQASLVGASKPSPSTCPNAASSASPTNR